ncbi:unnamed protein product [Rhizopus stolonifer]
MPQNSYENSNEDNQIDEFIKYSAETYMDRAVHIEIAESVVDMLKEMNEYEDVIEVAALDYVTLTNHAQ